MVVTVRVNVIATTERNRMNIERNRMNTERNRMNIEPAPTTVQYKECSLTFGGNSGRFPSSNRAEIGLPESKGHLKESRK